MTDKVIQIKNQIDYALHDTTKPWTSLLALAEKKTGVGRLYLFFGNFLLNDSDDI